jgi:trehalose-6-phosphate synthase
MTTFDSVRLDDEKLGRAVTNYVESMTREQLEFYVATERLDYFCGNSVDQEEVDRFIEEYGGEDAA